VGERDAFLRRDSAAAGDLPPGGRAPKAGEWFRNPDYARTLQVIADSGIGTFYGGSVGQRIVARLSALGGFLTLDDLRTERADWVTPISVPFRGYRVWELPPNNQGIAALEMLRILEPYDLEAMGHNSPAYLHHLIEAKKLAYADLDRFVGDADHLDMPGRAGCSPTSSSPSGAATSTRRGRASTWTRGRCGPRARRSTSRPPTPTATWCR
jgi:gamma-glutamyltranspeptidase/glutathione hydrolase